MQNTEKPDFQGSGVMLLKHSVLYVLITTPILSFCLMGPHWPRIFLVMLVLSVPFVLLAVLLVSRFDRISFDDDKQQIVKSGGCLIPYQSIKRIDIYETGRLVQIGIKRGFLQRTLLLYALDGAEKTRLLESLRKRVPDSAGIREKRHVNWKSIGAIVLLLVVLTAGFHLYLFRTKQGLNVIPQKVAWESVEQLSKKRQQYIIGNFSVTMPVRFQLIGTEEGALQFEDKIKKNEVRFFTGQHKDLPERGERFIRYITGIHNYYDVLDMAFTARTGVVPLILRDIALTGLTGVTINAIELLTRTAPDGNSGESLKLFLKGFSVTGEKKGKNIASVLLVDREQQKELHIFFSGTDRLDENTVQGIVTGIRLLPAR